MKPRPNPPASAGGDPLVTTVLGAGALLMAISAVLWGAGVTGAMVGAGHLPRRGGLVAGFRVLAHAGRPADAWPSGSDVPGPVAYWSTVGALAALVGLVVMLAVRLVGRFRTAPRSLRRKLHATPGVATAAEVARYAGPKALAARATVVRPSLAGKAVRLDDLGYRLGRSNGVDVWASVEDSMLILGPPRSGKGLHLVIPAILEAPGAVVTTSTRADSLSATLEARQRVGPVSVFDPQNLAGLPTGLRWSPIRGCEVPRTAMVRAVALTAASGMGRGGVTDGKFWEDQTRAAFQGLLHAAALDGAGVDRLFRWSRDPVAAGEAVEILRRHPDAAVGWEEGLEAAANAAGQTRDSIWMGVRAAFDPLADPAVRASVSPSAGEEFDPEAFLADRGTLFVLGTGSGAGATAGLLAAFIEDITETARTLAARSPGARLDPPLALILDEIANLVPLPSLPTLMADGGGTGITPIVVLQSLAQARDKWGNEAAGALWDAAICKVILGGGSHARDLEELSKLAGERDEQTVSVSHGHDGQRSHSTSLRRVPILPLDVIRKMPFGTALVMLRSTAPIVIDLKPWTSSRE